MHKKMIEEMESMINDQNKRNELRYAIDTDKKTKTKKETLKHKNMSYKRKSQTKTKKRTESNRKHIKI